MMMPVKKINSTLVRKLYYDLLVPFETSQQILEKGSGDYKMVLKHLEIAENMIDLRYPHSEEFYASLQAADDYIISEFYEKECGKTDLAVNCVGHSHMDIAWRWTVEQTREKAQRTFSSVIYLMKHYPEYQFMMTQPQLYELLREGSPEMFEDV